MLNFITQPFKLPSPKQVAQRDLENAQRQLLETQKQREYYAHMERMYQDRIMRLEAIMRTERGAL